MAKASWETLWPEPCGGSQGSKLRDDGDIPGPPTAPHPGSSLPRAASEKQGHLVAESRGRWPGSPVPVLILKDLATGSHLWAPGTRHSPRIPGWSAPPRWQAGATYRHGLERNLLVVVNGLFPVVGVRVAKAGDVHHVAEVEGQGDGQQACGGLLRSRGGEGVRGVRPFGHR